MVLDTDGTTSQVEAKEPERTVLKAGIYLSGDIDGVSDLNAGPAVELETGGIVAGVSSLCSQQ